MGSMVPPLRETQVRENVWVWTPGGDTVERSYGANCTAVVGESAVLLVDPLIAPAHARAVEEALRAKTDRPARFVVLTHHHTDHALGSSWFAARGATVISHSACPRGMAAEHPVLLAARRRDPALAGLFADAESVPPSVCFESEIALDLGKIEARVIHPGHGHTPGDAVVWLPGDSVLVTGDLVSNGYHVNYEDADLANLDAGLARLQALGAATIVPGHGSPAGPEILEAQRHYHRDVARIVREAAGSEAAIEGLKRAYPSHKLKIVLGETVDRWAKA